MPTSLRSKTLREEPPLLMILDLLSLCVGKRVVDPNPRQVKEKDPPCPPCDTPRILGACVPAPLLQRVTPFTLALQSTYMHVTFVLYALCVVSGLIVSH